MRQWLLNGLVAAMAVPFAAPAGGAQDQRGTPRPPDAHDLRRTPGDQVVEVEPGSLPHGVRSRYVPPQRGWRYRTPRVGERLAPAFYARRYQVDPARHRLPPAAGARRWIRYGDDLVLVNSGSGQVLRVVRNGFR